MLPAPDLQLLSAFLKEQLAFTPQKKTVQTRMNPKAPFSSVIRAVYFCELALPPVKKHRGGKTSCKANPDNLRVAEGSRRQCSSACRSSASARARSSRRARVQNGDLRTEEQRGIEDQNLPGKDGLGSAGLGRAPSAHGQGSHWAPAAGALLRLRR